MDLNQKRLKQEGISWYKDSQSRSGKLKRKRNDNDEELSVVSAAKSPKAIQGHNTFDTAPHWATPKKQRQWKKPTDIYVSNMNNVGSPMSTLYSPVAVTRTQTNTSNINSNSDNNRDNDVCEQTLTGTQVTGRRKSVTHFGSILSSRIVEGRTHYEILYDDKFQEEVDSIELSRRQELYYKEGENDVVRQQKQ